MGLSNIFQDMSKSHSTDDMDREEDQLTAAFLSIMRLCPRFSKRLLKKLLGRTFDTRHATFEFQTQGHLSVNDTACRPDAIISFADTKIYIENKMGAKLNVEQIEKYLTLARRNRGSVVLFIYKNAPIELERYTRIKQFNEICWRDIHRDLHLFLSSERIVQNEKQLLNEFAEYLEVIGLGSFIGFKKGDSDAWVRAAAIREQMHKYLEEFSIDNKKLHSIIGNYKSSISMYNPKENNGQDITLNIKIKTNRFKWKNKCDLHLGFYGDQYEVPSAYIRARVNIDEWNKIKKRKERRVSRSGTRALSVGRFEEIEKGRSAIWIDFISVLELKNILSKRGQKDHLDRFFYKGLKVVEKNIFHEVGRYR